MEHIYYYNRNKSKFYYSPIKMYQVLNKNLYDPFIEQNVIELCKYLVKIDKLLDGIAIKGCYYCDKLADAIGESKVSCHRNGSAVDFILRKSYSISDLQYAFVKLKHYFGKNDIRVGALIYERNDRYDCWLHLNLGFPFVSPFVKNGFRYQYIFKNIKKEMVIK